MSGDSVNVNVEESEVRKRKRNNRSRRSAFGGIGDRINNWRINGRKAGTVDLPFLFIVAILLVMGIIMMFSASYAWAISEGYTGIYYARRQMIFALIGVAAMFAASRLDYHLFAKKPLAVFIFSGSGF